MVSRLEEGPEPKKHIVSVIIIGVLLIAAWYGYAALSSVWYKYIDPQDQLSETENFNAELILPVVDVGNITLPDNWDAFLDQNGNPNIPPELLEWLLNNGNLSGDIGNFSSWDQLNTVVFRIYPEPGASISDTDLWRTTAYDEYLSTGWARSDTTKNPLVQVVNGYYTYPEAFTVRMPFGATTYRSFAAPTSFPTPLVENGSVTAENLDSASLMRDSEDGLTIEMYLSSSTEGNLSYVFYRESFPDESYWQTQTAGIPPSAAPQSIKDKYLQLPGGKDQYLADHPTVKLHYDLLQGYIAGNGSVSTYEIASVIRQYISDLCQQDVSIPPERPGGQDIAEWFLERKKGLPMDFAATYVVMLRLFGIPARYATGYNSKYSSDVPDPGYNNRLCREIRFLNMDAWAEVYFTTDPNTGDGNFAPMPFVLSLDNPYPYPIGGTVNTTAGLNIRINGTYSSTFSVNRNDTVSFVFELNASAADGGNASRDLIVYDYTEDNQLATVTTDSNGYASYELTMDNSYVAGPHMIGVYLPSSSYRNASIISLISPIQIDLLSVNPTTINRTEGNVTHVIAHAYDPVSGKDVTTAYLRPVVVDGVSVITNGTSPDAVLTDSYGRIDTDITITDNVVQGNYTFRVDLNGMFGLRNPYDPTQIIPFTEPALISQSSTVPFTVIDPNQVYFYLYINGTAVDGTLTTDRDTDSINISVYLEQAGVPLSGKTVAIYDRTYDDFQIALITTGPDGWGSTLYNLGYDYNHWVAGIHELYALWSDTGRTNGSIYIFVNETVEMYLTSLTPSEINKTGTGATTFTVEGYLWDPGVFANVRYAVVNTKLLLGTYDLSYQLTPDGSETVYLGPTGSMSVTYGVDPSIQPGVYDVRLDFNGTWIINGRLFQYPFLSASSPTTQLTINDPGAILLEMWIDGVRAAPSYDDTNIAVYNRNDVVNITVRLWQGLYPLGGQTIYFYDEKRSSAPTYLTSRTTGTDGFASVLITLDNSFTTGLVKLSAEFVSGSTSYKNFTVFRLTGTIGFSITQGPPAKIIRNSTQVDIRGYVVDTVNSQPLKGARVTLTIYDATGTDITDYYINWISAGRTIYTDAVTGEFAFTFKFDTSYKGPINITVSFTGYQQFLDAACPASSSSLPVVTSANMSSKVYAGVSLTAYYNPNTFEPETYINVWGTLTYDNGTYIGNVPVNISFTDGSSTTFKSVVTNTSAVDGTYSSTTLIDWVSTENVIYVDFNTDDVRYIEGIRVTAVYSP